VVPALRGHGHSGLRLGVGYAATQAAVGEGLMYGCVPETEKVYKNTLNT